MDGEIKFRSYDLQIKTLNDGVEVVQISPRLAFDPSFIADMRSLGVKEVLNRDEKGEQE